MRETTYISDIEAIRLHAQLRAVPIMHKSDVGERGCSLRAHRICQMIEDLNPVKAWRTTVQDGTNEYADGNLRHPPSEIPGIISRGYNFHVAPVIVTDSGKHLVLDIFLYETPPTLEEWEDSFAAVQPGTHLVTRMTAPETYDINASFGNERLTGVRGIFKRTLNNINMKCDSFYPEIRPHGFPVKAAWISDDLLAQANIGEEPDFLKKARGTCFSTANAAIYFEYMNKIKNGLPAEPVLEPAIDY